ncbi:MAG: organomercurial lyase [Chloroflexota bacterium]
MTELNQAARVVDDIRTFFDTTQADPQALRGVMPAAIRLLAEGRPVSPVEIAQAANLTLARVQSALRDLGDVEWTPDGRVEGLGLTPPEVESPDAATGEPLRIVADGRRILAADPSSIVISWFVDPLAEGVRAAACQYGHFFASPESAAAWLTRYPQGGVLSLDEAMEAARRSAVADFGVTP